MILKIANLKLHPRLQGANESTPIPKYDFSQPAACRSEDMKKSLLTDMELILTCICLSNLGLGPCNSKQSHQREIYHVLHLKNMQSIF